MPRIEESCRAAVREIWVVVGEELPSRSGLLVSAFLMLVVFAVASLHAQTASRAQAIPDFSGVWDTPYSLSRNDICGEPNCRALGDLASPAPNLPIDDPHMTPWADAKYKAAREDPQNPKSPVREGANPWFSACVPSGPTALMFTPFVAVEIRQFPDVVLLFFTGTAGEGDHTVRRLYLDGRGHPANWRPTPMGHSIGRYDRDTLLVDTIGISDRSWLDGQGYPQSDALHLVERFRRPDQKTLEYEVTIEDPQAYTTPWRKKIVRKWSPPGPRIWDNTDCEELLQMGTHYSAEAKK